MAGGEFLPTDTGSFTPQCLISMFVLVLSKLGHYGSSLRNPGTILESLLLAIRNRNSLTMPGSIRFVDLSRAFC
jgi:hypothetical protein